MYLNYFNNHFLPISSDINKIEKKLDELNFPDFEPFKYLSKFMELTENLSNLSNKKIFFENNTLILLHDNLSVNYFINHSSFSYNKTLSFKSFVSGYYFCITASFDTINKNILDLKFQCYNDNVFLFYIDLFFDKESYFLDTYSMEISNKLDLNFLSFLLNNLNLTFEEFSAYSKLNFDLDINNSLDYKILIKSLLNFSGTYYD